LILAADNLQITNKTIAKAIGDLDPAPIREMVKKCEAAGADAIDINPGPLSHNPEDKMAFLVNSVQKVSDLPIIIDTANSKAIEAGLYANTKTAIINGFSLEPAKLAEILPLAKKFNADIIGYLLQSNGHMAADAQERLNLAVEILQACQKIDLDLNRLIIDPVLAPLTWGNGGFQSMEVLSVIKCLPEILGRPVRTVIGLSNLTTGRNNLDKKLLLESAYLPMLAASGLSMVLINIFHHSTVKVARACTRLINREIFAWEQL